MSLTQCRLWPTLLWELDRAGVGNCETARISARVPFPLRAALVVLLTVLGLTIVPANALAATTPTTSVVLPSNSATLSGTQYFDATESAGTSTVQFELTGSGWVDHVVATATPTVYGWLAAVDTTGFYNGTYTLQSVATSGGVVGTSPGVSVTFNNPGPAVNIVLPSGGSTIAGNQVLDAVAGAGVRQVQYTLTGDGLTTRSSPPVR
jgi:hypothetical protein